MPFSANGPDTPHIPQKYDTIIFYAVFKGQNIKVLRKKRATKMHENYFKLKMWEQPFQSKLRAF